ncbi:class I adenylate cyclase [Celerinatantimonas diazotrophica]|uniref:Adenylate cyclase n=1 Tax=Celerinatantimonas diazotrophica TaxID=412034 RepID=A0A4R1KFD0_9GAMM|nr:class I adenylate cyclase [Celerinatantimonas diazotrophica]TCK63334.1 adenylate cyclase class 1 [Celerinatantimonas diazotrophica]CAG9298478.1 Adenylate cyclase [Celerinatantimonas diazotrophica]
MQQHIEKYLARATEYSNWRRAFAVQSMSSNARQTFELIPLLLHFNHPSMPGFVGDETPCGVSLYRSSSRHQIMLQKHFGCNAEEPQSRQIWGLYSMGSTASMGQSSDSDLDIWVCHGSELNIAQRALLQTKCSAISEWAAARQVELNFFLVEENQFKSGAISELSADNCGSAQHLLLLDEFYRTCLRIAGKHLVWYAVPADLPISYDAFVAQQRDNGVFDNEHWLDLGGLDKIPAEEYFGSALWQLYKGIDSPYKAVLKLVLMESYSADYPNTRLLACETKSRFQHSDVFDYRIDAYFMMLERVTAYLQRIRDYKRLDLVRRCFYLKNNERFSLPNLLGHHDWPRQVMKQLVRDWNWDDERLRYLNTRQRWGVVEVKAAYSELLDALMLSYRNLIHFARLNDISESINAEDIGILSRKLYAAFESLPGKVTQINPQISPELAEADLSFVQVANGSANATGWYLYRQPLQSRMMVGEKVLEHSAYISKLVAWGYFNQLLVNDTRLHVKVKAGDLDKSKLKEFTDDLRHAFPVKVPPASNLALTRPCEISHLGIFLNLESDPTANWAGKVIEFDAAEPDIFAFGDPAECLIGSIDLVYRNSWHEVRTLHFSSEQAVTDSLVTILSKMHRNANPPEHIDVFCYSNHFRSVIVTNYRKLLVECVSYRLAASDARRKIKTLVLGQHKYGLFFEERGVSVKPLDNSIDFYTEHSSSKLESMLLRLDADKAVTIPSIVNAQASEGLVQYFFEQLGSDLNIYIVDEQNRVEVYQQFDGSKDELVQGINRFYTSSRDQFSNTAAPIDFNLPQFYDIVEQDGAMMVRPYRSPVPQDPAQQIQA